MLKKGVFFNCHIRTHGDEDCDRDEVEDDLDDLRRELDERNENNSDTNEQCILEDEVIENIGGEKHPLNP